MLRKIFTLLVALPAAIVLIVFAVANRHAVTVSLDPFGGDAPAWTATLPLFLLILSMLGIGVIVGGMATWLNQSKWRRAARDLASEAHALRIERDGLRAAAGARDYPAIAPPR